MTSISVECVIVRLLGPVEVVGPHGCAVLSGRQRAMVGLLALQAGSVVLPARIVDGFWGENPPRTAIKSLHSHIARIRHAMCECGLTDVLLTRGTGYMLAVDRNEVDACHFEDQVRSARDDLAQGRRGPAADRLRAALELWTGDPVQGGELAGWGLAEVTRLQEARLTALEDLCGAELRLGHHAAIAGELDRLLVQHPLRERLVELQMLALCRTGRRLEALEAYQRLRARLANDLGVDPAPGLQRLHTAILRHDPELMDTPETETVVLPDPPMPRPAQLPPRVGHFTGRTKEITELNRVLDGESDTRVVVVSGRGGMGKTALAIQWAHQVKERFPDGQLFLDLRAMTSADALAQMLRSLGVPSDKVPSNIDEMANLYRSMLDGKKVLIILDNASALDQIRPLVPATTTSALVVTARRPMTALATYHAVGALGLDALGEAEALALLGSVVGHDRVGREPEHSATIVNVCGRMPLALRIAAAKLAGGPGHGLADLAAELSGDRLLDALSVDGDSRSVRTVFASAYRTLSPPAARMFRLLSLHPGVTFVPELAAAITGMPDADAGKALIELVDAYLVAETSDGRYRFHELIQLYASECARREDDSTVADRLLDWYLGIADAANRALDRRRDRVVLTLRHPPSQIPFAANPQDVLAFLDDERENLPAVVRFATDHGRFDAAWQLTYLLTGFFDSRGRRADRVEICQLGLAAAQRQGDPTAESLMRAALGAAYILSRRFDDALNCLYGAMDLARAGGDRRREAFLANSIATAYAGLRSYDEALEAYLQALEVHRENEDRLGIAVTLNNIGTARIRLGQAALSFEHLEPALRLSREIEHPRIEAWILFTLGEAHLKEHQLGEALDHFKRALEIGRAIGDRRNEVDALNQIGVTQLAQGDAAAAVENTRLALALSQELADLHLISICLTHLAVAQTRRGELDAADRNLKHALALRTRVPDFYEEAVIHRGLADHAQVAGRPDAAEEHREQAARLFLKANAPAEAAELSAGVTGT
ncbi:MAG TPA: BTAD domain-containing putative transcriptional regulator [Candidatus Limnocylindrales bacterium]|nr:BTAD domain-containing putative transcriptional regulator [Candidatus Limnocylindrales bacterium]